MTGAEYAKARRDKARAASLCLVCCKRPQLPKKSVCEHCDQLKAQWYACSPFRRDRLSKAQRTPDRFNVCCAAHGFHRDDCQKAAAS